MHTLLQTAMRLLITGLVLLLTSSSLLAQDVKVEDLVERLQAKYESIENLKASFSQTISSAFSDEEATLSGNIVMAGEKYRYETESQTYVTDGETAWIYLAGENQVLINAYEEEEGGFSPNQFFMDYEANFDATLEGTQMVDGEKHYVITLTPKSGDAMFQTATALMRDRDDLVTEMTVLDLNDTELRFTLDDIELNPGVDADTFTFTPPEGAEVIDLRS